MNHVDNPFQSPAVLSFCPGILGLERGIERAIGKIRVATYVEIEAFIAANLVACMEAGLLGAAPVWTDARTFDARPFRGRIHGIIGGYPCPGESLAGLREGHLYKGFIWPSIRKAIAAVKPVWCFFENVDDHLTGTYPIVLRSLYNMGYTVEAGIYSAEEVGAPHERKRLFIMAIANGSGQWWKHLDRSQSKAFRSSEVANSVVKNGRRKSGNISGEISEKRLQEQNHLQESGKSGGVLANTSSTRQQGNESGRLRREEGHTGISGSVTQQGSFPAGVGTYQHSWEEPRTIESSVGFTIDGYNFKDDLLRAAGNSVVEQTAEVAFIDLLNKHIKNLG